MSNRTKSFFDQNHSSKFRPAPWHCNNNRLPLNDISNNNVPIAKPPIPASVKAKSKLDAFQLHPERTHEANTTPANKSHSSRPGGGHGRAEYTEAVTQDESDVQAPKQASEDRTSTSQDRVPSVESAADQAVSAPALSKSNSFPCTPGTRLPLEDLIGNCDESAQRSEPPQASPQDQIGWIPNSSSALLTPNRKRKRAKSSSPTCPTTSSQRQEASAFFAEGAAGGEKTTPLADTSTDLWQRLETGKQAEGDVKMPDFSHLMFQASPRTFETPAKSAGLRRWASTGNEWPVNKSKRRRTNGTSSIALWQEQQVIDFGGKSKVAAMVEQLQETLATQKLANPKSKPETRIEGPSSSSPLPGVGAADALNGVPVVSPLQMKQQAALPLRRDPVVSTSEDKGDTSAIQQHAKVHSSHIQPVQPNDSFISAPLQLQSKARLPAYKRPSITRTPNANAKTTTAGPTLAKPAMSIELDEFADDLELSAQDIEELMTQPPPLQQRPLHQIPAHPNPPPQQDLGAERRADPKDSEIVARHALPQTEAIVIQDDDDDEFACDDIDEDTLQQAEFSATQAIRVPLSTPSPRKLKSARKSSKSRPGSSLKSSNDATQQAKRLQRYVVRQVVEGEYTNAKGSRCPEKILMAEDPRSAKPTAITLRDSWTAATSVSKGNIIHIALLPGVEQLEAPLSPPGQVMVSDAEMSPLLIVHPDHMLSATVVADSFDCIRKAVLQDRIKATGDTSKPMVYGKMLHEIFQHALSVNRWDENFLSELVDRTVENNVESLWGLGMQDTVLVVEEIKSKMAELSSWANIYVAGEPSDLALVDDKQGEKVWMTISKLIAIEEHVWSPLYGLKGNIDATVEATLVDHPKEPSKKLIAPFEVKTGRTVKSAAHRAQTALYTLLLSDRYDADVKAGILYYLESSAMSRIAPPAVEMRQMIQQRNRLAAYINRARHPPKVEDPAAVDFLSQTVETSALPAMLKNPFKCGRCYAKDSCFAYHALAEAGSAASAGMVDDGKTNHGQVWQEVIGHLQLIKKDQTQARKLREWFSNWDRLLTFEEGDLSKLRQELWTMNSEEREAVGRCFGNLIIAQDLTSTAVPNSSSLVEDVEGSGGRINRFTYVLACAAPSPRMSFTEGTQLVVGEPIVVSSEQGQWALANGYIVATSKQSITIAVDRRLSNVRQRLGGYDGQSNQSLRGIMSVGIDKRPVQTSPQPPPVMYRLDKDEFSNGLALVRNNLVSLMSSHPIHIKLRNQIISGTEPSFSTEAITPWLAPSQLGLMNEDQQSAVNKVLTANDYALILGMPGTGKTTTIAHIIRALLAEEKSILLTSYTHTAVDNILLKLRDIVPPQSILRLGARAKIDPQVQEFCLLAADSRKTIEEIEQVYMGSRIVAATCLGVNHALFNWRAFDVCIVDEASQITLPTSLGPLLQARKFVLVGDHYQLPPLVQNKVALEGGLDISLFRQLSEQHPQATAALGKQYRMNEDIMSLSNTLIYSGRLRCGNDAVSQRMLQLADTSALSDFHSTPNACATPSRGGKCWITELVASHRKVVFASTDASGKAATETLTSGKNITNRLEATLTVQLVSSLLALGVPATEIGVMTLYRSQLAFMRQLFKVAGINREVEIDSADRFQGRDKECIILSFVRSNDAGIVGDLLKDWRRVNVAITRARSKLIMLGSRQTLRCNGLLEKLLAHVDDRGWSLDLPKDADVCHTFNFSSQAATDLISQSVRSPAKAKQVFSPQKPQATPSPPKRKRIDPATILRESPSASNRSTSKQAASTKKPAKIISGPVSQRGLKSKKAMQQAAIEIFEDLTADNI